MTRSIIITADTILELFKDYLSGETMPPDARVTSFKYNKHDKGKLGIEAYSENWPPAVPQTFEVKFDLRRTYGVGGMPRV